MERRDGGREGEIVTLQHRFSTHTYFEFDKYNHASHCRCGHPVVPQVPLANNETQPVRFAPQYKTRYPFYRWVS